MSTKRQDTKQNLAYSSIGFGFSLLAMTITTVLMYFFTDVVLLPAIAVTGILFVVRLFDGLIDPLLGFYMDRRMTKRGKYRGYILYWAVPMCLAFVLLFWPAPFRGGGLIAWYLFAYLFFTLAFSFVEIASLPLLATFNNGDERSRGNTYRIAGCIVATLIAVSLSFTLVQRLGGGSEQLGYFRMALLFAVAVLAAVLIGAAKIREGSLPLPAAAEKSRLTGREALKTVWGQKSILFMLCMNLCLEGSAALKIQAGIYYLKYNLGRQDFISLFLTCGIFASLLAQPLVFYLSKRLPLRRLMIVGCLVAACAMLLIGFAGSSMALLMAGNIIFGLASAFPANLIYVNMLDLSEQLAQKRQNAYGGMVNSLIGVSSRLGSSLSSALITFVLYLTAYTPNVSQSASSLQGIQVCFVVLTIVAQLLAAIFAALALRKPADAAAAQGVPLPSRAQA